MRSLKYGVGGLHALIHSPFLPACPRRPSRKVQSGPSLQAVQENSIWHRGDLGASATGAGWRGRGVGVAIRDSCVDRVMRIAVAPRFRDTLEVQGIWRWYRPPLEKCRPANATLTCRSRSDRGWISHVYVSADAQDVAPRRDIRAGRGKSAFTQRCIVGSSTDRTTHRNALIAARLRRPASLQSVSRATMLITVAAWTRP